MDISMRAARGFLASVLCLHGVALVPPTVAVQNGGPLVPGTYRCSSYNASGGGGSCRTMPPLVLQADGSYRYSSTRGTWSVRGGKLVLSQSNLWGPGDVLGPNAVRFQYDYRGWHHVVTWTCQACAAPSVSPGLPGSPVGVSLTLEFGEPVGGATSFVIVPEAAALPYAHNAPLPPGAVQGLARETGPTAVLIETSRDNRLLSGRRYVVFLSWPRETIPVAILELPPASGDYHATLQATLDGASVMARIGK